MNYPILLAALVCCAAAPALAQSSDGKRSAVLTRVVDCRKIGDAQARLACFDREVAAMEVAEASKNLVVVDRDQLRKTRRTLFGLTLPNLSVFGDDNADEEGVQRIETTIKSVRQDPYGKYIITLEDGARWAQTDSIELSTEPKAGHAISIRRAAMGSYLANIREQRAIRVRRMQ